MVLALTAVSMYVGSDQDKAPRKYKLKKKRVHAEDPPLELIENPLHYYFKMPTKGIRWEKKIRLRRATKQTPKSIKKSPRSKHFVGKDMPFPDEKVLNSELEWQAWLQKHVY